MRSLKRYLLGAATGILLMGQIVPASAVSWGGFSIDPNPLHPSIGVPGGHHVEATPLDPLHPLPSITLGGNGDITNAINSLNRALQSAPTEALKQALSPLSVVGESLFQPVIQDAHDAATDLLNRVQQAVTDAKGGALTLFIEALIVFFVVKTFFAVLGTLFRRRRHT